MSWSLTRGSNPRHRTNFMKRDPDPEKQLRWARHTKSGYESMKEWYETHPEHASNWAAFNSPAKQRHYAAACRILMILCLTKN